MEAAYARNLPDGELENQKLIIVTGFGPFVSHENVNASWEAVKLLPDTYLYNDTKYLLQKRLVPVDYAAVDTAVDEIWAQKPELVIHCGVHGLAKCVHVEKLAYNNKFTKKDYAGNLLSNGCACITNDKEVLTTGLNVHKIVEAIENTCSCQPSSIEQTNALLAKPSYDVGGYLCGYIFLKSLDNNTHRTLFLHVPTINQLSSERTCEVILSAIQECLRQVENEHQTSKPNKFK